MPILPSLGRRPWAGFVGVAVLGIGFVACSKATTNAGEPTSATTTASTGATSDVTVTKCKQDPTDTTQVDVSGTIVNHLSVTSDYNFVVSIFNGSTPAAQAGLTQNGVAPGLVETWSASSTIAGSTTGSFSCRVRSVLRTPSHS